jgi:hypothetical protein
VQITIQKTENQIVTRSLIGESATKLREQSACVTVVRVLVCLYGENTVSGHDHCLAVLERGASLLQLSIPACNTTRQEM